MATVYKNGDKEIEVKNLGWLLRNRNNYGGVLQSYVIKLDEGARLNVFFQDNTVYTTDFADFEVCKDWANRHLTRWAQVEVLI